jgi:adenylate cyclase
VIARPLSLSPATRLLVGAALGLVVAALAFGLRRTALGETLELRLVDVRTRAFADDRPADPSIVVCTIEDPDVVAVKRDLHQDWPWPLDLNQGLFHVFEKAKVKAVLVDVLHLDRGQGPDDYASSVPLTDMQRQMLEMEADAATVYGAALGKARGVVALELSPTPNYEVPARVAAAAGKLGADGVTPPAAMRREVGANLPARRVADGARLLGFVNTVPDVDGVVRRAHLVRGWGDRTTLSLPLAGLSVALDAPARTDGDTVVVGSARQRVDADGSFLVDFRGPSRATYTRVPASKVLEWAIAAPGDAPLPADAIAHLQGKIVVWGVNLAGAKDLVATPLGGDFEGPVFQATVVDDLLHGDGRVRVPAGVDLAVLALLGAGVGALTVRAKRRWLPLAAVLVAVAALFAAGWWTFARGLVMDLGAPTTAALVAWAGGTLFLLFTEGRYNKWLEGAFGLYLAPSVIDALKVNPSLLALGGARRDITVLFSDVAGFSSFSRQLGPENLVKLLNEYLTSHGEAIHAEGGTISKFIGDAVMAVYGDPVPQPDQAVRACRTALDVQRRVPELRPLWTSMGLTSFAVRVGVNSGPAVVGNMGSRQRFDYTSMGEIVNLSSRLEGANKYFGTKILIGPATREQAGDAIVVKQIGRVVVVGWDTPEPVYELVAMRDGASADLVAHVAAWDRAAAAMRAGDLAAADRALAEAERLRPGDGACAWLRTILAAMRGGAEPTPWSGVVRLEGKG